MTLRSLLRLFRIPNVFTAAANVTAGVLLARGGHVEASDLSLVAASACLYLAGMVLNDFFDREVDAIERPSRPIPSGEVPAVLAGALGFVLLGVGVAVAFRSSATAGVVASGIAGGVLLYDGVVKATALGPVAMGLCRFLNVVLGFAAAPWPEPWLWVAPVGMGMYTVVITFLARDEVAGAAIERNRAGFRMMTVLLASFVIVLATTSPARTLRGFAVLMPFLGIVIYRGRELFAPLLRDASPPTIGRAIGGGIALMPVIDACVVAAAGYPAGAALVALLAVPPLLLKRWYYLT